MPEVHTVFFSKAESEIDFAEARAVTEFDRLAAEVLLWRQNEGSSIFRIGMTLLEAKTRLPHGRWLAFLLDGRVGYQPRPAQLLMNIGRARDGETLARFGVAKATELLRIASLPDRERFVSEHNVALLTVPELRRLIKALGHLNANQNDSARRSRPETPLGGWNGLKPDLAWALGVLHLRAHELSEAAVEASYRELAKILHSDHGKTRDDRFMQDLNAARTSLKKHVEKAQAA